MKTRLAEIREYLHEALLEDWGPKALSLLVALALWAWVQSGLIVDEKVRAEVRYVWPEGLARLEEPPPVINLTVQGPQALVRRLTREQPTILVDLAEAAEGTTSVDYTSIQVKGLPEGVEVTHHSPPSFEIKFERPMTRRVPVRVAVTGEVPNGYRAGTPKVTPSMVEVTGPRSLVRPLADVPTDPIDLSDIKSSRSVAVPLNLPNQNLTVAEHASVQVSLNIEAIQGERPLPERIVEVDTRGFLVSPATVTIILTGPVAELDRLSPDDVRVIAHLPDPLPTGRATLGTQGAAPGKIEIQVPPGRGIQVKRVEPATITVEHAPR